MTNEPIGRPLIELADKHLDDTLTRLDVAAAPVWESQIEVGRTLLTLSSGALVLSITFMGSLTTRIAHPLSPWLIRVAWVGFTLAAVLCVSRQAWMGRARSARLLVESRRGAIRGALWAITETTEDFSGTVDRILIGVMTEATNETAKALRVFDRMTQVTFASFALGLIALLVFALRNFPF